MHAGGERLGIIKDEKNRLVAGLGQGLLTTWSRDTGRTHQVPGHSLQCSGNRDFDTKLTTMRKLPDLLRLVLRTFCYVEWHELSELGTIIKTGTADFDVDELKIQLETIIGSERAPVEDLNGVTGFSFETDEEARQWLIEVHSELFA